MKICHITDWLPNYHEKWGGAEQAAYRLAKLLSAKGVKSLVLSTRPLKPVKEGFEFLTLPVMEDYLGKIGLFYQAFKLRILSFDPVSFWAARRIFKKQNPDIVHLHSINVLSLSVILAAKLLKIPVVACIYDYWWFCPSQMLLAKNGQTCQKFHGLRCLKCIHYKNFNFLTKIFLVFRRLFFSLFIKKIDKFVVLSESSARILKHYGIENKQIKLIRLVFPIKQWVKKDYPIENHSLLYNGWLEPHKGLDVLVKALPEIIQKVPDLRLYISGKSTNPAYFNQIQNLIKKFSLEKNIVWVGAVSSDVFQDYFNKAQVVVIPEQWENMSPFLLLESMAAGKPVVASRIGGIPEFIKHGVSGLLASPKSSQEFAQNIVWCFKNSGQAKKIGQGARQRINSVCGLEKNLNKFLTFYKSLIT